jgi:putative peptide zinc metalloprotease protein
VGSPTVRPRLRDDLEPVVGFDGTPLLFDPASGAYTRLTGPAEAVLHLLDGSRSVAEVAVQVSLERQLPLDRVEPAVTRFVAGLRQASLLENLPAEPATGRARVVEATRRVPVLRIKLGGPFEGELPRALRRLPARAAASAWLLLALGGLGVGIAAAVSGGRRFSGVDVPVVVAVLLAQLAAHESAHAVVCRLAGAPVRQVGIAFWYYVLPIAYIDRTDAYRVRSRSRRAAIALAGPANDAVWIGVCGSLALAGILGGTFHVVVLAELLLMLGNFNPFLPTDGQQALEASTGLVSLRGDGIAYVAARLLRVQRPLPAGFSGPRRRFYLAYGSACIAYLLFGATMILSAVALLVLDLVRWVTG